MTWWPAASSGCHSSAQASSDSSAPWVNTSGMPAPAATACSCPPSPVGTRWWSPAGSSKDSPGEAVDTVGLLTGVAAGRSAATAGRARLDTKAAVDGGAEGLLAGIVEQVEAHPVGRVGIAEAQVGVGEAECAAGAFGAERAVAGPKRAGRAGLEEAGGVSDVGVPDQVAPSVGWRHPRCGQLVQGAVGEPQGPGTGGQLSEAAGDGAYGADSAGGRDLDAAQLGAVERPGAGQPRVAEGAGRQRPGVREGQQHPWRHGPGMQQQPQPVEGLDAGDPLVRHLGWQPDVEVQTKRGGDLLGEEAPEGAPCGIGAPDQLGGDPPGGEVVVALAGPGSPLGRWPAMSAASRS